MRIGIVAGVSGHIVPFTTRLLARGATVETLAAQVGDADELVASHPVSQVATSDELADRSDAVLILEDRGEGAEHARLAKPYLRAGIPTFIDKPLMPDLDPSLKLLAEADAGGAPLMTTSSARYAEPVAAIGRKITESGISSLVLAGTGTPWFYGVHLVEIAVATLGPGFRSVQAFADESGTVARFQHSSNVTVTLSLEAATQRREGFAVTVRGAQDFANWLLTDYAPWYDLLIDDVVLMATQRVNPIDPAQTLEVLRLLDVWERATHTGGVMAMES